MGQDVNNLCLSKETVHIWKTDFISSLKDFFTFRDNDWKLELLELKWKNIADIWAGFSDNMNFLKWILWNNSKIICVDWIYENELVTWWLDKTIKNIKIGIEYLVDNYEESNVFINTINDKKLLSNKIHDLWFLKNWNKEKWIEYKTELEKNDNIDIAFCKNLFYTIKEPIRFITEILEKLNNNWELVIIDYDNLDMINIRFLIELSKKNFIDWVISTNKRNEYVIFKIKKETFLDNLKEINNIFNKINNWEEVRKKKSSWITIEVVILESPISVKKVLDWTKLVKETSYTDFIISKKDFQKWIFPTNINLDMIKKIKDLWIKAHSDFLHFYLWIEWEVFCEQDDDKEYF